MEDLYHLAVCDRKNDTKNREHIARYHMSTPLASMEVDDAWKLRDLVLLDAQNLLEDGWACMAREDPGDEEEADQDQEERRTKIWRKRAGGMRISCR